MRTILLAAITLPLLVACSSQPKTKVLGSDWVYAEEPEIIYDARIGDNLRIRLAESRDEKCASGIHSSLEIDGEINSDTSFVVERLLEKSTECITKDNRRIVPSVYMNSKGGSVNDGLSIGRMLRKHGVSTRVINNQQCSSSCAFAFLGGTFRGISGNGRLLFHAPYRDLSSIGINAQICENENSAQDIMDYYKEMLEPSSAKTLFDRTMSICSTETGWTVNADAAELFGITKK